ncbi:RNA 3'-terminal phosphate cyclase domain-containing protein [Staphylotrichum tortipilum]|uniref:RNA 3'-terminal phosphate cyclase domain-containing protein n=1 Tax=Staphylotrichum tortipilum TaxID=2831512 RepID=A0AAN6RT52_9PEZI|nr:RNA 3'-terminal phosphate cyclase domain-containing protein [Staphylotrichum longicolle]
MKEKKNANIIELDGRTGEGGGQLVRIACALASVATQPIRIIDVRGNREGPRGGGLKSQHVTAIEYLAAATDAEVDGLSVGSHTLTFIPRQPPSGLLSRNIKIEANSPAASTMLIFQAIFPFLLFAANDKGDPITLSISGGTNVSFSLSFEYLDQVLLPALHDAFGIAVDRRLLARGWSLGRQQRGRVEFTFRPLKLGEALRFREGKHGNEGGVYGGDGPLPVVEDVEEIDVSLIIPSAMHQAMREALEEDLEVLFPGVEPNFKIVEDSGSDARVYVLLVARAGIARWGRDSLSSMPKNAAAVKGGKGKNSSGGGSSSGKQSTASLCATISRKISKELYEEVSTGGVVDEFLQDQLVVFQALAEGRTSFRRGEPKDGLEQAMDKLAVTATNTTAAENNTSNDKKKLRKEKTDKPFGEGSTHTTTARWVTAELLPVVAWYNKGSVCDGVGVHMGAAAKK